jgi:hypothetical protein
MKRLSNGNLLYFDPVNDMDPIPQCTGDHPMTMCFLFEASELPPGNQQQQ